MTLREMSVLWGIPLSKIHAAAIIVNGGLLGKGRRKWKKEQEEKIKEIAGTP